MGIKLAKALGNDVMAISTSFSKEAMAKEKGATMFACSKDPESMKANAGKCDLILNTVSADHDINTYLPLLAKGGSTIVQLGVVPKPHSVSQFPLMVKSKNAQEMPGHLLKAAFPENRHQDTISSCFLPKIEFSD